MTAVAKVQGGWRPCEFATQLPAGASIGLGSGVTVGRGQFVFYVPGFANVELNDGSAADRVCAGTVFAINAGPPAAAGSQRVDVHQGLARGVASSTTENDAFTASDVLAVCYEAGNGTPGKLGSLAGVKRSIVGLVLGLDTDNGGTPIVWSGPQASLMARALLMADRALLGHYGIADAAASTTTAERAITRAPLPGLVTAIEFSGAAIAANDTDYATITIAKRSSADSYANATTIATYDTRSANNGAISAFVPAAFTLSAVAGALDLLADDIVTVTVAKGGSGKVLTGAIRIVGKVI